MCAVNSRDVDKVQDMVASRSRRRGLASRPSCAKAFCASETGSCASSTAAPIALNTRRNSACAKAAPKAPVEAPITMIGFPRKA
jgi:hypothetical protein